MRPRFTDACVGRRSDSESTPSRRSPAASARDRTTNPGADAPVDRHRVLRVAAERRSCRAGVSHGSIFGCCLKSVNHEHAGERRATRATSIAPTPRPRARDASSAHVAPPRAPCFLRIAHRAVATASGLGRDPDAEVAAAEARVVADGHRESRNARRCRTSRTPSRAPPTEHHHLEAEIVYGTQVAIALPPTTSGQ